MVAVTTLPQLLCMDFLATLLYFAIDRQNTKYFYVDQKASKLQVESIKKETTNTNASSNMTTDDTFSLAEKDWYIARRKYASDRFVLKSFLITSVIEIVASIGIGYGLESSEVLRKGAGYIFTFFVLLHILILLVLAFKLRKAKDGFSIKSELRATGIWWLIVIIALLVSVAFLEGYQILYVLYIGYIGAYFTVIVFPLFRSYVKPYRKIIDLEKAEVKSLKDIFRDEEVKGAFKEHLAQHFLVEEFFFLEKLDEFKSDPKLQIGRAVIMYQKFIKHGAFLDLRLPKDVYANIESICNDEQKAMTQGVITSNFFDSVEKCIQERMQAHFESFLHSQEFQKLKEKRMQEGQLIVGLSTMGITQTKNN